MTPVEPRLVRKLLPPLTNLIRTTPAMSLLYECIHTVIVGGMLGDASLGGDVLAKLCTEKLSSFLDDDDQNRTFVPPSPLHWLLVPIP
jgi:AP-3 complex subunit delta-1